MQTGDLTQHLIAETNIASKAIKIKNLFKRTGIQNYEMK